MHAWLHAAERRPAMRLTQFSNYAMRVLMYTAVRHPNPSTVPEIAAAYGISYNHLKKAAALLCGLGYLDAVRGRHGGVRLARPVDAIRVGEVIRRTEGDLVLVECFDTAANTCPMAGHCRLQATFREALEAFLAVLDRYTLADLVDDPGARDRLLSLGFGPAAQTDGGPVGDDPNGGDLGPVV